MPGDIDEAVRKARAEIQAREAEDVFNTFSSLDIGQTTDQMPAFKYIIDTPMDDFDSTANEDRDEANRATAVSSSMPLEMLLNIESARSVMEASSSSHRTEVESISSLGEPRDSTQSQIDVGHFNMLSRVQGTAQITPPRESEAVITPATSMTARGSGMSAAQQQSGRITRMLMRSRIRRRRPNEIPAQEARQRIPAISNDARRRRRALIRANLRPSLSGQQS